MLGVFFMEFSIYLVYFSACHVYWLIFNCDLSNCVVGVSGVVPGYRWASSKYCKSRHRAPYPPGRCRQLVRPMWSHPVVTSGAPRRHPHPRCPRPRLVARQLWSSCRRPHAPVQKKKWLELKSGKDTSFLKLHLLQASSSSYRCPSTFKDQGC